MSLWCIIFHRLSFTLHLLYFRCRLFKVPLRFMVRPIHCFDIVHHIILLNRHLLFLTFFFKVMGQYMTVIDLVKIPNVQTKRRRSVLAPLTTRPFHTYFSILVMVRCGTRMALNPTATRSSFPLGYLAPTRTAGWYFAPTQMRYTRHSVDMPPPQKKTLPRS